MLGDLSLDRVGGIAHVVRNRGIYQREHPLFSDSHLVKYFLRDINYLKYLVLTEDGIDELTPDLDVLKLLLVAQLYIANNLVDIVCYLLERQVKQILQRKNIFFSLLIPIKYLKTAALAFLSCNF